MNKTFAIALLLASGPAIAATGAPINEPALVGRSDIIHFESWESTDWWKQPGWNGTLPRLEGGWEYPNVTTNQFVVDKQGSPVPGSKAFAIELKYGSHVGTVNPRVTLNPYNLDEAYIRYYVFMPTSLSYDPVVIGNVTYRDAGKLPGLARRGPGETQACCMGQDYVIPADGAVGWSARMYFWGNINIPSQVVFSNYIYHLDDTGDPGSQWTLTPRGTEGQWHCIEQRIKMNSIVNGVAQNDGIVQNWLDGNLAGSWNTLKWRTVPENNIGEVWFGIYIGGANVSTSTQRILFDNFVVARNRVGCYTGTGGPVPLATPAGITFNE
jgi:hypothetical protein